MKAIISQGQKFSLGFNLFSKIDRFFFTQGMFDLK